MRPVNGQEDPEVVGRGLEGEGCHGSSSEVEGGSGGEVALEIEMGADRDAGGCDLLRALHAPEPLHRPLASSKREMRVLRPVDVPASCLAPSGAAGLLQGTAAGAETIRDEALGATVALQGFPEEFQHCLPVPRLRLEALQALALVIDCLPQVAALVVDLHEHLVELSAPAARSHALDFAK